MASIKLGGDTFSVTPLGFLRSLYLQPKLAPVIAEVAAALFTLMGVDGLGAKLAAAELTLDKLMELDLAALPMLDLAASITRICHQLKRQDLEYIVRELLYDATMNGTPLLGQPGADPIDGFLVGRSLDGWRLLFYAVKVNYPDVFSPRVVLAATGAAAKPSAASGTSGT
jgi:hypothetical protein